MAVGLWQGGDSACPFLRVPQSFHPENQCVPLAYFASSDFFIQLSFDPSLVFFISAIVFFIAGLDFYFLLSSAAPC